MREGLMSASLVIMTKFPEPGKVKTRLAARVGAERACGLHAAMVGHLMLNTLPLLEGVNVRFHVAGGDAAAVSEWLGDWTWQRQVGGDLGEKMQHALEEGFREGAEKVVIIGTDAPAITAGHIEGVISSLDGSDVVFIPAMDGGYVMAGMKGVHEEMLGGIEWSTEEVLSSSVERLRGAGKSVALLDSLRDVDVYEDLEHAAEVLGDDSWLF